MYYLSFDCANKSLGVSFFKFKDDYNLSLLKLYNKFSLIKEQSESNILSKIKILKLELKKKDFSSYFNFLKELNIILDSIFTIHYFNVINLLEDKKTKDVGVIDRTKSLKSKLNEIDKMVFNELKENKLTVCIEYQMNCNDKSRTVYNQLIYNYSCIDNVEVKVIAPAYKNKIYIHKDLKHNVFIQKYRNNYIANKKHTYENFKFFVNVFNHNISHIKKKNIDDIADSFIQTLYIIYK